MPDTLFLQIIRHLSDLYWENRLTPDQIKSLAKFTLELSGEIKERPAQKSRFSELSAEIPDETTQILRELFPESAYSLV